MWPGVSMTRMVRLPSVRVSPLLVVALVVLRQAGEHHIHVLGRLVGDVLLVDVHRHVGVFLQQRPDGGGVGQSDRGSAGCTSRRQPERLTMSATCSGLSPGSMRAQTPASLVAQQVAVGGNKANPDGIDFHGIFSFIKHRWDVNGRVEDRRGGSHREKSSQAEPGYTRRWSISVSWRAGRYLRSGSEGRR